MSRTPRLFRQAREALSLLGAAAAAAAAVEAGRVPRRRDLEALGIDPHSFKGVHLG